MMQVETRVYLFECLFSVARCLYIKKKSCALVIWAVGRSKRVWEAPRLLCMHTLAHVWDVTRALLCGQVLTRKPRGANACRLAAAARFARRLAGLQHAALDCC